MTMDQFEQQLRAAVQEYHNKKALRDQEQAIIEAVAKDFAMPLSEVKEMARYLRTPSQRYQEACDRQRGRHGDLH